MKNTNSEQYLSTHDFSTSKPLHAWPQREEIRITSQQESLMDKKKLSEMEDEYKICHDNSSHLTGMGREGITDFQRSILEFVEPYEWKYFITLTFKYSPRGYLEASEVVGRFINLLSAYAFGGRSQKRVRVFPVIERCKSGVPHIHLLAEDVVPRITSPKRLNAFDMRSSVIDAWQKCSSKTTHPECSAFSDGGWFKEVYDLEGVVVYMTKELKRMHDPVVYEQTSFEGRRFH